MPGLSSAIYQRCREALLKCNEFDTDSSLRAAFVTAELAPFRSGLPEAASKAARVDGCLVYLAERHLSDGRSVLPLFLSALRERYTEGDALRDELGDLVEIITDADSPLERYLRHILATRQYLQLRGIPTHGDHPLTIPVESVFIPLRVAQVRSVDVRDERLRRSAVLRAISFLSEGQAPVESIQDSPTHRRRYLILPVLQVLVDCPWLVLLGEPGSGKTTLLSYFSLTCARALLDDNPEIATKRLGLEQPLVPLVVPLREFANYQQQILAKRPAPPRPVHILDYLKSYFSEWDIVLSRHFLTNLLEEGRCLVLYDGLEEAGDVNERIAVARTIEVFAQRYPRNRYIVTSRQTSYTGLCRLGEGFEPAEIQPFDENDVRAFASSWSLAVESGGSASPTEAQVELARRQADDLLDAIKRAPRVQTLTANPLLLTTVAIVHQFRAHLPERRAELYEECIEILLGYWDQAKVLASNDQRANRAMDALDKRAFLEPIALRMHEAQQKSVEVDRLHQWLIEQFSQTIPGDQAQRHAESFVKTIREGSGILISKGLDSYSFSHMAFQEFLAARHIAGWPHADQMNYTLPRLDDPWWHEVILLQAGYLSTLSRQRTTQFIEAIAQTETDPDYLCLVLAARCLRDAGRYRVSGDLWQKITNRLLALMSSPEALLAAHLAAGNALSELGDPRFEGPFLLPPLVSIPAGTFWMGSEGQWASAEERPLHQVSTPDYRIARYPVTNAQYACFVADSGHPSPVYWDHGICPPDRYNHPVVGISLADAITYCGWLTDQLRKASQVGLNEIVRLPTEAEWERAARGDDDQREWPWGDAFAHHYANVNGPNALLDTSPVGIFPLSDSPFGVADLVGNVWEYCWNPPADCPLSSLKPDPRARQRQAMVRGGSWISRAHDSRCSYRGVVSRIAESDDRGFRFVIAEVESHKVEG